MRTPDSFLTHDYAEHNAFKDNLTYEFNIIRKYPNSLLYLKQQK